MTPRDDEHDPVGEALDVLLRVVLDEPERRSLRDAAKRLQLSPVQLTRHWLTRGLDDAKIAIREQALDAADARSPSTLAERARAVAELDRSPVAEREDVLTYAAENIAAFEPGADPEDVVALAERLLYARLHNELTPLDAFVVRYLEEREKDEFGASLEQIAAPHDASPGVADAVDQSVDHRLARDIQFEELRAMDFTKCEVNARTLNIDHPETTFGPFCRLDVEDTAPESYGVYAWTVDGVVMYVGRADVLRQVVHGMKMGRAANDYTYVPPSKVKQTSSPRVRVNGLLNAVLLRGSKVSWWWLRTDTGDESRRLEAQLISDFQPAWNRNQPAVYRR